MYSCKADVCTTISGFAANTMVQLYSCTRRFLRMNYDFVSSSKLPCALDLSTIVLIPGQYILQLYTSCSCRTDTTVQQLDMCVVSHRGVRVSCEQTTKNKTSRANLELRCLAQVSLQHVCPGCCSSFAHEPRSRPWAGCCCTSAALR